MAERKNLCYNCFQEKPGADPCPHCGFDLEENDRKFPVALRAGTVLNGRYIVGRVLGQGGFGITYLALDTQLNAKVAIKEFMPNDIATRIGTTVSVAMDTKSEEFAYGAGVRLRGRAVPGGGPDPGQVHRQPQHRRRHQLF